MSYGVETYPYSDKQRKDENSFYETLDSIVLWYNGLKRNLRNVYNWQPYVVDKINVDELIRIKEETDIDHKKKEDGSIENDIEDDG